MLVEMLVVGLVIIFFLVLLLPVWAAWKLFPKIGWDPEWALAIVLPIPFFWVLRLRFLWKLTPRVDPPYPRWFVLGGLFWPTALVLFCVLAFAERIPDWEPATA